MTDERQPATTREYEFDQRALTEDQRYLAEDIATSMPDGHEEACGVWSEDGDGCDCQLVLSVANGLHASRIVAVEAERGWDSAIGRGDRVVRLPFRPMPAEASPAASGDALRAAVLQFQTEYPLANVMPLDLIWKALAAAPSDPEPVALDVERLALAIHEGTLHNGRGGVDDDLAKRACVQFGWEESRCRTKAQAIAAEYDRLTDRRHLLEAERQRQVRENEPEALA